jgi:hypothetical protein
MWLIVSSQGKNIEQSYWVASGLLNHGSPCHSTDSLSFVKSRTLYNLQVDSILSSSSLCLTPLRMDEKQLYIEGSKLDERICNYAPTPNEGNEIKQLDLHNQLGWLRISRSRCPAGN